MLNVSQLYSSTFRSVCCIESSLLELHLIKLSLEMRAWGSFRFKAGGKWAKTLTSPPACFALTLSGYFRLRSRTVPPLHLSSSGKWEKQLQESRTVCLPRPSSLASLGWHSTAAWCFTHKLRTGRKDLFLFFLGHLHANKQKWQINRMHTWTHTPK